MHWLQIVLVAWGAVSMSGLAVLCASCRAGAGYDRWHSTVAGTHAARLREAA